jgi:orotidine-5'-phosphate decarboxylase
MCVLEPADRVFVALDTPDMDGALSLAGSLAGLVGGIKLGKAFFTANGPQGVRRAAAAGLPVFLDLKFHDIPNTVADAVRAALALAPVMLTVHASGGAAMMRAAADAAEEAGANHPLVLGVTVLTSLGAEDLAATGLAGPVPDQVMRLARLAQASGLDGVVCSAREVAALREACGAAFKLVVPGIRPAGAAAGDQKRTATPAEAIAAGADYLVIGRPVTGADDPAQAARAIIDEIEAA